MRNNGLNERAGFREVRASFRRGLPPRLLGLGLVSGLLAALAGQAAVRVWDGSQNGYWSQRLNWSGDLAPAAGDDLVFPAGAANLVNTNDLVSLTFGSVTVTGSNYLFRASGGGQLQLTGGISAQHSAGFCIVAMPVRLRAGQTWECTAAGARLEMPADLGLDLGSYTLTIQGQGRVELGAAIGGSGGITKNGAGTLRLSGSMDNTYSGLTRVYAGVVELAKSGLVSAWAVPSGLIIENDGTARWLNHNQVRPYYGPTPVTVRGAVDLNGYRESVAELLLEGGQVLLGSGGVLTLLSNVTASGGAEISGAQGRVELGGAARFFTVTDTVVGDDLKVSASVGGSGALGKEGDGQMLLSASNSYSGVTFVAEGTLAVSHSFGLGGGAMTVVRSGATLELRTDPFRTFPLAEPLTLSGRGAGGMGALRARNILTIATAYLACEQPVELLDDSLVRVDDRTSLALAGVLSGSGGLAKTGSGELVLGGGSHNTYQGETVVEEGVLALAKPSGSVAIPGTRLIIGDGAGGRGADLVRLGDSEQIGAAEVLIRSSGLLDLNGQYETFYGLLEIVDGEVQTGAGTLLLGAGSVVRAQSTLAPGASFHGHIRLAGGAGSREFAMLGGLISPALRIYAAVSGDPGVRLFKTGPAGLDLWASNSFAGELVVAQGSLLVCEDHALGASAGGTVVSHGASLVLASVAIGNEPLSLAGPGDSAYGALWSGNSLQASWTGPITLAADATVGVIGTNGQLTLAGRITGPGGLTKVGDGTLVFSGSATNDYAGDTRVHEGTLRLAKTGTAKAISHGTLYIGDGLGGEFADRVVWDDYWQISEFVNDPIFPYEKGRVPVVIQPSGWMHLNGYHDVVLRLTLHAGRVDTGAGTLCLDGDLRADSTATNMALIEGNLSLIPLPYTLLATNRTVEVAGTNSLLGIRAQISGTFAGLRKTGTGRLSLSGANDYSQETVVSAGVLSITSGRALGGTIGGTLVEPGATLALSGFGVAVTDETLVLAGEGFQGQGALVVEPVFPISNYWSGQITLSNDTRIGVGTDSILNLAGAITGPGGLTKTGPGRLRFSGSAANTYAGLTRVSEGTLELQKTAPNGAVPGRLEIGPATVRLLTSTQIGNAADVNLASTGVLDLNHCGEAFDELSGTGTVQLGNGYLNLGTDNGSAAFDGQITGAGDLTKYGTGTLTLRGNNSYTGATTVREGTLIVDGAQPGSAVTVQSGATLRGTGWIGPLTVYGRVQPGNPGAVSPGVLFCGNLALGSSGRLAATLFAEGSDRLQVQGTVQLGNAALELTRQTAPWLGQRFWLMDNDGADPVSGTFAGLPEGATVTVDGVPLALTYQGGSSNDVVLTFARAPLAVAGVQVHWGNGNGVLDPGDCSLLHVLLTNATAAPVQQVQAHLQAGPAGAGNEPVDGLWLLLGQSAWPDLPAGAVATNHTPFQLWLAPWWTCGRLVPLRLEIGTATHGEFVLPMNLPTGQPGTAAVFSVSGTWAIPDGGTVEVPLGVSSFTLPVAAVELSTHITHTAVGDLILSLVAPDGLEVFLTRNHGGTLDDYGLSCVETQRTTFSDAAPLAIGQGAAPFAGAFRPDEPLSRFIGRSGSAVNGTWTLRVRDTVAGGAGTLRCASLVLRPPDCAPGGGPCELCSADFDFTAVLTTNAPVQRGRLRTSAASSCLLHMICPGVEDEKPRHYHAYRFVNGDTNACISVRLTGPPWGAEQLFSAAYADFDPAQVCAQFRGTAGRAGNAKYAFTLGPRQRFVVVVSQYPAGPLTEPVTYRLQVSGGSCRPWLEIAPAGVRQVSLGWSSAATDCALQATDTLNPPQFAPLPALPVVVGGRCTVTNPVVGGQRYYRLEQQP
jgi:autotransporter-associated beta strand protein